MTYRALDALRPHGIHQHDVAAPAHNVAKDRDLQRTAVCVRGGVGITTQPHLESRGVLGGLGSGLGGTRTKPVPNSNCTRDLRAY